MAPKTKKLKTPAGPAAPQTKDQCASAIADYARVLRHKERLQLEMNNRITAITEEYQPQLDQLTESIDLRLKGIQIFCEANRDELTNNGQVKFANLITGQVEWRKATDSVTLPRGDGLEAVIKLLEEKKLDRFIRTTKEVNKQAILLDRTAVKDIPGIRINTGKESFSITPFEQEA